MSGRHAVVVLAAGGSVRLGRPKQLLTRDGETLVHRMVRLAASTSPSQLLVIVGANRDAIAASVADLDCTCIANKDWQQGLSTSLRMAGIHLSAQADPVLVLACDQPALEGHHLQALLEGARSAESGCAATLHGDAPGVPAVVPSAWFDQTHAAGDRGFGSRLRQLPAEAVFGLVASELLLDVDDLQDLGRARELGWVDGEGAGLPNTRSGAPAA